MLQASGALNGDGSVASTLQECPFFHAAKQNHDHVQRGLQSQQPVELDGSSLTMGDVELVARHQVPAQRSQASQVCDNVQASVDLLQRHLDRGDQIYGVNTGFGGSADVRTRDMAGLQQALLQMQNSGVLTSADIGRAPSSASLPSHALPRPVVKAAMITRCNSLLRGHSAVRLEIIDKLVVLLNADMIPVVPLRGSISASGDLSPLSYIAGVLEGNPDLYVQAGPAHSYAIMNASAALEALGMEPVVLGPKEGLGLLNGTAVSAAAACLVGIDVERLMVLAHRLCALAAEGMRGAVDNYDPFIAAVRPHPGQIESASLIVQALHGSQLASRHGQLHSKHGLCQDRYALRTASQWLGPQLEDLALARRQVQVELNSTTDNPLINVDSDTIHHGGNFQAASITSAMDKTRLALQMAGKLLFAQLTEVVNPMLNGVLPPNLACDDPSTSFAFKGVDINMAAYMSELAFFANPVGPHVQSAEMHNQAVNSMALVSARFAADAVEVLSLMVATHLYVMCQAVDLQVCHFLLEEAVGGLLALEGRSWLFAKGEDEQFKNDLMGEWTRGKSLDLSDRVKASVAFAMSRRIAAVVMAGGTPHTAAELQADVASLEAGMTSLYCKVRARVLDSNGEVTAFFLGHGTKPLYLYVRQTLGVPAFKGLVEHPTHSGEAGGVKVSKLDQATIGSRISKVYEALRAGHLWPACF